MMMKKLIVVLTVLAMASVANAGYMISVNGIINPADCEITLLYPTVDAAVIDLHGAGNAVGNAVTAWLAVQGLGSLDASAPTFKWANSTVANILPPELGPVQAFLASIGYPGVGDVVTMDIMDTTAPFTAPNGLLINGLTFHCLGEGDVILTLFNAQDLSVFDVVRIHQIGDQLGCLIYGTTWHDKDGDGHLLGDPEEEGLSGWRIYADRNLNNQFDTCEPNTLTDASGNYTLIVTPGTWVVAEEDSCWEQTCPGGNGSYNITLEGGQSVEGYNFGNAHPAEIHPSGFQNVQQDKLIASDGAQNDCFGQSVSTSGDYAIVGACYDDDKGNESGSAYIFALDYLNCSDWDQMVKLTALDGAAGDGFGNSVSICGNYAAVGAVGDDDRGTESGSAYIFKYDGTIWSQQAKLTASDGAANDNFGCSVSISGDYAIVGAFFVDEKGSAYIFKRDGTNWSQQAKLTDSDGAADDAFGISVSISGNYAIVGAYADDGKVADSGSAFIFKHDGTTWVQQSKLTALDGAADDGFGVSVSISGNYAIVGAYGDDDRGTDSGSAYIFKYDGATWSQQAKLTALDGARYDYFGYSVSISGDYAIIGAYYDDDKGSSSGSAYFFKRDGAIWSQQAKLIASDGAADDRFGYSVSISRDYAIVGAYHDDDRGSNSGSAYMFGKTLCPSADLNGDCLVDFKDIALIASQWLQGTSP